jgi:hypothetical protein
VVKEWISVATFRAKEKITVSSRNRSSIGRLPKKLPLIIKRTALAEHNSQKQDLTSEA